MSWYPEAQGSYEIMAYASDGWPIYKKNNDSTVMFYENSIPAWLVSDKTSSLIAPKFLKYMKNFGADCPDVNSLLAPWLVLNPSSIGVSTPDPSIELTVFECECENITVYSQCSTFYQEPGVIGVYENNGTDLQGRSTFRKNNTFQLLYDTSSNVRILVPLQGCWNLPTSGGGQKEGILRKNSYFEGILRKF